MKNLTVLTVAFVLPLLVMSCTEEAPTTARFDEDLSSSSERTDVQTSLSKRWPSRPSFMGGGNLCDAVGPAGGCDDVAASNSKRRDLHRHHADGFVTPLFGLATAPNGDILIADAGAGIAVKKGTGGRLEIRLPGVTGIGPIGRGTMWATVGAAGEEPGDSGQALYRVSRGRRHQVINLYAFEQSHDPDGHDVPDSNPFDVASLGGHSALVVDAAGNDLLRINKQGRVHVLAVFPDELVSTADIQNLIGCPNPSEICDLPPMIPAEPVPTSVAVGRDGYYYVGELKGFPAPIGVSNIWRVSPKASWAMCGSSPDCVKVFDGGFTSIIDLAFDRRGKLYVAELDVLSWAAVEFLGGGDGGRIRSCDLGTLVCEDVASGIPMLTAITFAKNGDLKATENALIPELARVIKVR